MSPVIAEGVGAATGEVAAVERKWTYEAEQR
jgi:hypothetical protein